MWHKVFWHQSEARTAATVWNWSGKTLSPGALLAVLYFSSFHIYFSAGLHFPSPPLSAPGSPRMRRCRIVRCPLSGLGARAGNHWDGSRNSGLRSEDWNLVYQTSRPTAPLSPFAIRRKCRRWRNIRQKGSYTYFQWAFCFTRGTYNFFY